MSYDGFAYPEEEEHTSFFYISAMAPREGRRKRGRQRRCMLFVLT
jgi:hypothetical protein